jgi:hypothetical protein
MRVSRHLLDSAANFEFKKQAKNRCGGTTGGTNYESIFSNPIGMRVPGLLWLPFTPTKKHFKGR